MKKVICAGCAVLLGLSCCMTAFAANTAGGSTAISADIAPAYTVTIPEKLEIPYESTEAKELVLTASGILLERGKTVAVTAAGSGANGAFAMTNGTQVLSYELSTKKSPWSAIAKDGAAAAFAQDGTSKLYVKVPDWDVDTAGKYAGTITFTISYQ